MENTSIKLTSNIWRWILFVPTSIIASEFTKFVFNKLGGSVLRLFSPLLEETITGIFSWSISAIVIIYVADKIIPYNNKFIVKIYSIILSVLITGWTILCYFLDKEGLAGSFWFPLLLNISFFAGIWGAYFNIYFLNKQKEEKES